ncbi:VOC family protein [Herbiconiux sp. UC225_62]|uniref:VOC family protein n=1 Tax=Herbiconiux sp. UC225_62 TaxID=3350168 RepID=UPI0036D3C0B0
MTSSHGYPAFRQVVLDTENARELAEFYHHLLALPYEEGDEPPLDGPDPNGEDWLALLGPDGKRLLAFQQVASLAPATWPEGPRPQQLHLDFSVPDRESLLRHRERALQLGATILREDLDDPEEPITIFADPSGHPFCIFMLAPNA